MFTRLLLVLFSCLVFQQKCLADESYGYLRNDGFSKIPCTTGPFVNATGFLSTQLNGMINCSMAIPPAVEHMKRHTLKCERFPDVKDDPLPCAKRNYKVRFSVWFFNFTFFVHMCRLYNNRSQRSVYFSVCAIYIPICLMCNCVGSVGNKLLSHAPEVKRKSKPSRKHIS